MMAQRWKKSKPALILLTIFACILFFIAICVIVSGCILTLHNSFQDSTHFKDKINKEYDYSHYWTGGSYLITAALTLVSGCWQRKRRLTFITAVFLLFSLAISLFAIVLDGPDWVEWKDIERTKKFWENKKGFTCWSHNYTCICSQDNNRNPQLVSTVSDCDQVVSLAAIYGVIISGAIVGLVVCLATLMVMVNSVSWKNPWKAFTSYTASYVNKAAFSSVNDVMEMYKEHQRPHTVASSSTSSLAKQNKEYMPAWSLYGSTVDEFNNPAPY